MKGSVKILSVILIIASVFGIVGGGIGLADVLECKAYWEDKSAVSTADLATLEDGLNTLAENKQTYIDGLAAYEKGTKDYEDGQKTLEDGKKEYEDGQKTLEEKTKEYNDGLNSLKAAEKELAEGKATLEANKEAYAAGKASIASGEEQLETARALIASNEAKLNGLLQVINGINAVDAGLTEWQSGYSNLTNFGAIYKTLTSLDISEGTTSDESVTNYNNAIAAAKSTLDALPDDNPNKVNYLPSVNALQGVPALVQAGQQKLATNTANLFNSVLSNDDLSKALQQATGMDSATLKSTVGNLGSMPFGTFNTTMTSLVGTAKGLVSNLQSQYDTGMQQLEAGKKALAENEAKLEAGKKQVADYEAGQAKYNSGLDEYYAGRQKLVNGKAQLDEGKAKLEAAEKTIKEGEKSLTDAEKQLADGKAKLEEFEAGQKQVIEGIETVLASETYGNLVSIADRLGPDYKYLDSKDMLDTDQGLAAVAAAREFSAENGAVVTKELTARAVGAVLAIIAGVAALVAGAMGLIGTAKIAGIIAAASAVVAVIAAIVTAVAGSTMSAVAGSTVAAIVIAAGAVVAVVAAVHAVGLLAPKKAAV